ncbi:AAA family ATPase [Streptomyces sp. NPDC048383]|uniref:AAA family ATPase n=1 Tax=Streptomyces sp. NPDC048383 TaxID=3155386 RepID=UPI00343561B1
MLLTATRLVEYVGERTLVIIDEPETHLHPPLLAAFVRVLSDLLTDRNGLAIIATHSPVVLQEVPAGCVYKLRRYGDGMKASRPTIETFGENVGVLTHEVFGLEVTDTGYHRYLATMVAEGMSYQDILNALGRQLGGEGRIIARSLVAARDLGEFDGGVQ